MLRSTVSAYPVRILGHVLVGNGTEHWMTVSHTGWPCSLSGGPTSTTQQQEERKKKRTKRFEKVYYQHLNKGNSWVCGYLYDPFSLSSHLRRFFGSRIWVRYRIRKVAQERGEK